MRSFSPSWRKVNRRVRKRNRLNGGPIRKPKPAVAPAPDLSLVDFVRDAWPVVEPGREYVHNWHIDAIADHLEAVTRGEIQRLIINIPPRHSKSLIVAVFWPAWEWTFKPAIRWLFSSYSDPLSTRDSVKCRDVILSPWYQKNWGHVFRLKGDQNLKTRFQNTKMGHRIATTVGGSGTGEGGDRIITDDPINRKDVYSELKRENVYTWWTQTMSTRGDDPDTAAWVVIAQRLHTADLPGRLMDDMKADGRHYETLILPAEYIPNNRITKIGFKDPRKKAGELLNPARFGPKEIAALKKELGSIGAAAQLQQDPRPEGGNIFKHEWLKFWKPAHLEDLGPARIELPNGAVITGEVVDRPELRDMDEVAMSWDMTFKGKDDSDFVAGQVWGKLGASRFLLDQEYRQMDIVQTLDAVRSMAAAWPRATRKIIEDKANGPAVIRLLRGEVPGLIAVNPQGGKVARANAAAPIVEGGDVYLPHPMIAPWVNDLIVELCAFPAVPHDDRTDALTQILIYWTPDPDADTWGVGEGQVTTPDQMGLV